MSRAYFFGNMYLSSIQQGIQAGHVISEMTVKYWLDADNQSKIFYDWAKNHKTMILLNGGYASTLHDLIDFFDQDDNPYPWEFFKESEGALDSALTSVGIVLPEKIYEGAAKLRIGLNHSGEERVYREENTLGFGMNQDSYYEKYTKWEKELMERINKFGLAR